MIYNLKDLEHLFNLNKDYLIELRNEIDNRKSDFKKFPFGVQRSFFSQYLALNLFIDNLGLTIAQLKDKDVNDKEVSNDLADSGN